MSSIMIHDHHEVAIPFYQRMNSDTRTSAITWDPTQTIITNVKLNVRAFADNGSMEAKYYVNNREFVTFLWGVWEGNQWREHTFDISSVFANGPSYYKAQAATVRVLPWTSKIFFTSTVTVTFTGVPPNIKPPKPAPDGEWAQYIPWIVAGLFGVGLIIIASKRTKPFVTIERRKK